jgi:hypothetical protein
MDIFKMSKIDFYKKKFPSPFSEKSIVSIMLSFVKFEKHVVSIRFFQKNRHRQLFRARSAI